MAINGLSKIITYLSPCSKCPTDAGCLVESAQTNHEYKLNYKSKNNTYKLKNNSSLKTKYMCIHNIIQCFICIYIYKYLKMIKKNVLE